MNRTSTSSKLRPWAILAPTLLAIVGLASCSMPNSPLLAKVQANVAAAAVGAATLTQPGSPTMLPGANQVDASWPSVSGATGYKVFYSASKSLSSATAFAGNPVTTTKATISALDPGTSYWVWVTATNLAGDSPTSLPSSVLTLPAAPGSPSLTPGIRLLGVSWSAVSSATSYKVFYNRINSTTGALSYSGNPVMSGTSVTLTGLTAGSTYYAWIVATNASGDGAPGPILGAVPFLDAGTPVPVVPANNNTTINVSWAPVDGASSYSLYYSTDGTDPPSNPTAHMANPIAASPSPAVSVTGLVPGTTYYFWLKSTVNGVTGPYSQKSSATLPPNAPPCPTLAPSGAQITASWSLVSGATSYKVYYNTGNSQSGWTAWNGAIAISSNASTVITGLTPGSTYWVWAVASDAGGDSAASSPSNSVLAPATMTPSLTAGTDSLQVSWSTATNASGYKLFYGTANDQSSSTPFASNPVTGTGTSATLSGLLGGTVYYVWLVSTGAGGDSAAGTSSQTTLPDAPPINSLTTSGATINLAWSLVTGATAYEIHYAYTQSGVYDTKLVVDNSTSSTILTGLVAGDVYTVTVAAQGVSGNSLPTPATACLAPSAAAVADTGYNPTGSGYYTITVTPQETGQYTRYYVYGSTGTDPTTATQFAFSNYPIITIGGTGILGPGTAYNIWIKGYTTIGLSDFISGFSPMATVTTAPPSVGLPTITSPSSGTLAVSWTSLGAAAAGYKVFYNPGGIGQTLSTLIYPSVDTGNVTSTTISGLISAQQYCVWVVGYDANHVLGGQNGDNLGTPQ